MPALDVKQQSIVGDVFNVILFPFRVLFKAIAWIFTLLLKIVLFPFKVIASILKWIWNRRPQLYLENLFHSFKGLWGTFFIFFLGLTFLLLFVLTPLYALSLFGAFKIPTLQFEFIDSLVIMVKTITITEISFFILSLVGFLACFVAAFIFMTTYSPLKTFAEFIGEITESKLVLIMLFFVAFCVFGVVYLLLSGRLPL